MQTSKTPQNNSLKSSNVVAHVNINTPTADGYDSSNISLQLLLSSSSGLSPHLTLLLLSAALNVAPALQVRRSEKRGR